MKFETRRYFLLPFIPGPKIVLEGRTLFVHKWFGKPKEIPLGSLTVDPGYGGFSIRGGINWLTGCGNLELTGSAVGSGGLVLRNIKNFKGILSATSSFPRAEKVLAEKDSTEGKKGLEGLQYSCETSSTKIKIAKKKHKADFGAYPDISARFEDTKIETPFGAFIFHHDGTVSDMENKLMWIQAPWGMEWNGKKFKGESIKLSWNDATKMFGFGGTLPKLAGLKKEDIEAYGDKEYKSGKCVISFSGYRNWRLATARELLAINFSDDNKFDSESGYRYPYSEKSRQLRDRLFPDCPNLRSIWSANDNGGFAWANDGNDSLGDYEKHQKVAVLFVRNR